MENLYDDGVSEETKIIKNEEFCLEFLTLKESLKNASESTQDTLDMPPVMSKLIDLS